MEQRNDRQDGFCILLTKYASVRVPHFCEYIAFGTWADAPYGPCVRFDGGSPFSSVFENAPFMRFNIYGDCEMIKQKWMDAYTCPNAFEESCIQQLIAFIQTNLPILHLVYERFLDKEDALAYFEDRICWGELLSCVYRIPDELYSGLLTCENNAQLHLFCVQNSIYGKNEIAGDRPLLCERLKAELHPEFEMSFGCSGYTLEKYSGNRETVYVPDYVEGIEENAFYGHTEIKQIVFPDTVEYIGKNAFSGCSSLKMLSFPSSLNYIDADAFAGCEQLQTVIFDSPDIYLPAFEEGAFRGCKNLTDVDLADMDILGGNPFIDCPQLTLRCRKDSSVEALAQKYHIPYIYVDTNK